MCNKPVRPVHELHTMHTDKATGPQSLEHYFQKGALLGQKVVHLIFGTSIPGQIRKNCSREFEGLSYLAYKILKTNKFMFSYTYAYSHNSKRLLNDANKKYNLT